MRGRGMGDILKKVEDLKSKEVRMVYTAFHFMPGEEKGTVIEEFDTKEAYDAWYESTGKSIEIEEGGRIRAEFGPSEIERVDAEIIGVEKAPQEEGKLSSGFGRYAVRYRPAAGGSVGEPFKLDHFASEADRQRWYEKIGRNIEQLDGGKMEFYEEK